MSYTVKDIYQRIDSFAPFEKAMASDNVGLLIGHMDRPVDTVLTALDVTPGVVEEAKALGAQLLVTHHPLLLVPANRLDEFNPEAALISDIIRANLSFIAAHTNLDQAEGGVNDALAQKLGWQASRATVDGLMWAGTFPQPMPLETLRRHAAEVLGAHVALYGREHVPVERFAMCCGSGGSQVENAAQWGAQLFFTGELKHDKLLEAMARGMVVFTAGHRETEICAADLLAKHLLSSLNGVQLNIRVFVSKTNPFA